MPKVTDPLLLRQLNGPAAAPARKVVTDPILLSQLNGTAAPAGSTTAANDALRSSLPMPGTSSSGAQPNLRFGLTTADTPNPLPALDALGSQVVSSLPIVGPALTNLSGGNDPTTKAEIARNVAANPEAATVGRAFGSVAPYMAAAEVPLVSQALGFTGPWLQRLGMTLGSQFAINAADNQAHGQDAMTAAKNAIFPAAAAAPLSLIGPGGRALSPTIEAAQRLQKEGIPLTAGQQRGSNALMQAESQLGGIAAQNFRDKQLGALTKTALKYAGVDANTALPAVMDKAYNDYGTKSGALASMTTIRDVPQLLTDIADARYQHYSLTGADLPIFNDIGDRIHNIAQVHNGVLPGASYAGIASDVSKTIRENPGLGQWLGPVKDALDDSVERNMGGQTKVAWQKLRQQYANLMRVTDAVTVAGGAAKAGLITPEALDGAMRGSMSKRQYARGYGDMNQLARDAVLAMPKLANSGTASRMAPYAIGAGAANMLRNPSVTNIGATIATLIAPQAVGRAMLSAPGREVLAHGTNVPAAMARGIGPSILPQVQQLLGQQGQ